MNRREIDALVRAHRGRPRAVAFLHVLRQPTLEDDDHAFLGEVTGELTAADLLRWRARTELAKRAPILVQLAKMAAESPAQFEHEVLNAPGMSLEEREWETLADLTRGKAPPALFERIERRDARAPKPAPANAALFAAPSGEGPVDLASMLDLDDGGEAFTAKSSGDDLLSLGDEMGLDLGGDDGGPLFADPFAGLTVEAGLAKARAAASGEERAMILAWLEGRGVPIAELLDLALAGLRAGQVASPLIAWVSQKLSSDEAWHEQGVALFSALIAKRAFPEMQELLAQGLDGRAGAACAALRTALIDITRDAIKAKDEALATAALSGLACIDPGDEPKRRYPALKQAAIKAKSGGDVLALVDLILRLARRGGAQAHALEGMVAAVHALSDALS